MDFYDKITETKIKEAIQKGELDNLPGKGKPVILENPNPFILPEDRMSYKIMKNLGLLPQEVELRKEIDKLQNLIKESNTPEDRAKLKKKLEETNIRYKVMMERRH